MKIGLDVTSLTEPNPTGVGEYIKQLTWAMLRLPEKHDIKLFYRYARILRKKFITRNLHTQQALIPFHDGKILSMLGGLQVFHGLDFRLPCATNTVKVSTVHDLFVFQSNELLDPAWGEYGRHGFMKMMEYGKPDHIIVPSKFIADEFLERFEQYRNRVSVVPHGVSEKFSPADQHAITAIKAKYGLPERYLFHVGSIEPRKNLKRVIEALVMVADDKLSLVVCGFPGYRFNEIKETILNLRIVDRVIFIGYVPADEKSVLYSGAVATVYTSLYEGFGFPVLEAMACGSPVITSKGTALEELVAHAALLVDPTQAEDIAAAIKKLLQSESLRADLSAQGRQRAALYSWDAAAVSTLKAYETAIEQAKS